MAGSVLTFLHVAAVRCVFITCLSCIWLESHAASPQAWRQERSYREACLRRIELTDFAENRFANAWMTDGNLTAFEDCLYRLRTKLRPPKKQVHAGGVHYPTIIVTNHRHPVVSTSGASWCWIDKRGTRSNGLSPSLCCDLSHGPRGLDVCWDKHFSYELCCKGDLDHGEIPHFFSVPAMDINVGNTVKRRGTFDMRMSYALQSLCQTGYTVLDVGANLGAFTVPLAEKVGRRGRVYAFEPFRTVFQHLNANVALNGLSNVYTYNFAIGREERELELHSPDLTTFTVPSAMRVNDQYDRDAAAIYDKVFYEDALAKVTLKPLDSFSFDDRTIDFIKIDVEFMELEVVIGARETIKKHRPVMWVENEAYFKKKPPDTTFVDYMAAEFGYSCDTVADLELLCTPPEKTNDAVLLMSGAMKHLNLPLQHLTLQRVLSEIDPAFATKL